MGSADARRAVTLRLFFAIELPARVQATLGALQPDERPSQTPPRGDYRWADPALLHVTLVFLGQQPADRLAALAEVGAAVARDSQPAQLTLGEVGHFGPARAPRVLWVGLDGELAALHTLQARLDAALRAAGLDLEDRPYRPHVTLARRRETAGGGPPTGWPPARRVLSGDIPMRQLTLFESRLSPRGPAYTPLAQVPLGSPADQGD